jgi:hypothetical protein
LSVSALVLLAVTAGSASALSIGRTPDPTWQANGRVLAILRVGNVVYLGGEFTQVMAHGGGKKATRNHLAAFNATTGNLLSWNPNADDSVRSLAGAVNGTVIFAGGDFRHVGGGAHSRVVKLNAGGAGKPMRWSASANGVVRTVKAANSKLYMGGDFTSVNGHARARLAAVGVAGGAIQSWAPRANAAVRAVLPVGSRVFIGGDFLTVNGKAQQHLVVVNGKTGVLLPWASHPGGGVNVLQATTKRLFEGDSGGGGHVRAYGVKVGHLLWTNTTDGNVEGLALLGKDVIAGGHFNQMGAFHRKHLGAINKVTGRVDTTWNPEANSALGVFSAFASGNVLFVGGDFTAWQPGNVAQAHFARFS